MDRDKLLLIRGHHLLCMLGFRGLGYSDAFVANMTRIVAFLRENPDASVKVVASPDSICAACPHLSGDTCVKPSSQGLAVDDRDLAVLNSLGLRPGHVATARDLYRIVASTLEPPDLAANLCRACQWLSLGCCAEGLARLKTSGLPFAENTAPPSVTITDVLDNVPFDTSLRSDVWGFAALVDSPAGRTLFDTGGDGDALLENMSALSVAPESIDRLFFSHIDYDHTGGLDAFLRVNSSLTVFAPASFPAEFEAKVTAAGARFVRVSEPLQIAPGLTSTGELPGVRYEESLIVDTTSGPALVTGCAHPGIVSIARRATEVAGRPPHVVIGGFHLHEDPPDRVRSVARALIDLGVKSAAPTHCTGPEAIELFREVFADDFVDFGCGARITL